MLTSVLSLVGLSLRPGERRHGAPRHYQHRSYAAPRPPKQPRTSRYKWTLSPNNNSCNSFKTNDRVNSYSIQNELLLATKCSPALAPLTRHQRIRTSQDLISNRNTTSFKIPANAMKINPKPKSNRNKKTIPPFLAHRESPSTNHYSPITNHTPLRPMSHCYIRNLIVTPDRSPLKINRKPCRLEIRISHRKQTPAAPINRKQNATSRITNCAVCVPWDSHSRRPCTSWRDSLKMLGLR